MVVAMNQTLFAVCDVNIKDIMTLMRGSAEARICMQDCLTILEVATSWVEPT